MTHPQFGCPCCGGAFAGLLAEIGGVKRALQLKGSVTRRAFFSGATAIAGLAMAIPVKVAAQTAPVTVFSGGTILTVDKDFSEAEAIAIQGSAIIAVGSLADVQAIAGEGATRIELAGRVLLPGFIDAHTHVVSGSIMDGVLDNVGMTRFGTAEEVLAYLSSKVATASEGEWILARNYDPALQTGPEALTFAELDAVSLDNPVFVLNASGHIAYANRRAFAVAGVPEDVENPSGAEFVRDANGNLTGEMHNSVAFLKILGAAPAMASAEPIPALIALLAGWSRVGLTTVSELAFGTLTNTAADADILMAAAATGQLQARVRAYPFYTTGTDVWDDAGIGPGYGNAMARIAGYKLVADGSNQGFTGHQREPYVNSDSRGIAYMTPEEMATLAVDRATKGWAIAIHGNGDAAIDKALDTFQAIRDAGVDPATVRGRIEHCSILHDDQIARMKDLGVSPSFLIGHVHYWGVWMRDMVFGPERVNLLGRANSVSQAGIGFSIHSDFTVTDPDPLHMIEMAVTRRTWKEPDFVLNPDERVSVEYAIRAVTSEAAWQLFSEHEVGSLEVGKLADLVILEADPRRVDPDAIKSIRVLETWLDGKQVYQA